AVLLGLGVATVLLSSVGMLLMHDALDRLHFTAPASTVCPVVFAAAVLVEEPLSSAGVKAVLVALLVLVTTPVLTHATARAARVRAHGRWKVLPEELERIEPPR
ncbi:MAG: multicomponent Na+:H+ antiporter subunit, partial [Solirubrobacteraceae bacterium]|nr:multicomponent Na+:H+ antiporter subunit [Solirubrobacteraceae bacterium]